MKFQLSEVFCEIISGLFLCSAFAGLFLLLGILTQAQLSSLCTVAFKLSSLPALLLAFYIAGILFDPVGMLVDNLIEKTLSVSSCSAEEKGIYYAYAPEHLVAYRHETWSYYFCFRNLLLLIPINSLLWLAVFHTQLSCIAMIVMGIITIGACISFWFAMKNLLDIYYGIPKKFKASYKVPSS